jgi:hypothetical protein
VLDILAFQPLSYMLTRGGRFDTFEAPLLFEVMKLVTTRPLHLAIDFGREDVVLAFITENVLNVKARVDELDEKVTTSECACVSASVSMSVFVSVSVCLCLPVSLPPSS